MAIRTSIEWTESTWNPVTGCTKISAGCKNCYAERMAKRLKAMGQRNYRNGFRVTVHPHALNIPIRWQKPQMVFVNSMSDLFHKDVSLGFIQQVFDVMVQAERHRFQVLTKRAERLLELSPQLPWLENVWMGVSVENEDSLHRIDCLRDTGAHIKFISFEPLLGPIRGVNLEGIDWVIVGGESGPRSRAVRREWVTSIRDQCQTAKVPFFFKQWGGFHKKRAGRRLEGRIWSEMPQGLPGLAG